MQAFENYLKPELLVLVPVLYIIGIAIKKSSLKDNFIPFLLGIIGIFLAVIWVFGTETISTYQEALLSVFTAITQGILCAGASVYVNQLIVQNKKDE